MHIWRPFWLAVLFSAGAHCAAFGALVVVALWPSYTSPQLIVAYGNSDREGFPFATIAVNPGAWREGDEHTPGGNELLPEPLPLMQDQRPQPALAPEPAFDGPAANARDQATPATAPPDDAPKASPVEPKSGSGLPGAAGGARMANGTPSAGGTVGSRTGARMAEGGRPPTYPQAAREAGIEGTVFIRLRVSTEGELLEAKIERSSGHPILDDAALRWARTQKFIPARIGKTPVESEVIKPVRFFLY
jgi:protein TonB